MPGCNFYPGDSVHLLSGECPALTPVLHSTLSHSLNILSQWPTLLEIAKHALSLSREQWAEYIVDPTAIVHAQEYGKKSIWPLFKLSRAYIWSMHRTRKKIESDSILP